MIRTCLIGLGNIGLLFDESLDAPLIRSHAKALLLNPRFELAYAVDPLQDRLDRLRAISPGTKLFTNWRDLIIRNDFSVLVICVPTELHFECLSAFKNQLNLKVVILEKPAFAKDLEYQSVPHSVSSKVIVNYSRRFSPQIQELRSRIKSGIYGTPLRIDARYSKGLINNGSHLVDLINFLFLSPEIESLTSLSKVIDYNPADPTVSAYIKMRASNGESFEVFLLAGDERFYSIFDLDIFFTKGRVKLNDFCREIEEIFVRPDPISPGYRTLASRGNLIDTNLNLSLKELYAHASDLHDGIGKNISSLESENCNRHLISKILSNSYP